MRAIAINSIYIIKLSFSLVLAELPSRWVYSSCVARAIRTWSCPFVWHSTTSTTTPAFSTDSNSNWCTRTLGLAHFVVSFIHSSFHPFSFFSSSFQGRIRSALCLPLSSFTFLAACVFASLNWCNSISISKSHLIGSSPLPFYCLCSAFSTYFGRIFTER